MTDSLTDNRRYSQPRYSYEQFWVDTQPFLLAQGYELRPRYHPHWVPSWTLTRKPYNQHEDRLGIHSVGVLDATRIHDGKKVILKRVPSDGPEIAIMKYLAAPSLGSDPRNRTIPLVAIVPLPDSPWSFLVMPYCREFNHPPFHCRNEFLEAMGQFLEVGYIFPVSPVTEVRAESAIHA
ncbi:hypothetical protein DFH09DRAFT_899771 [Mycena vulgaris]|nr:hypothetical protein DFH09DRAFT_899771 [Mycena vulgaris]